MYPRRASLPREGFVVLQSLCQLISIMSNGLFPARLKAFLLWVEKVGRVRSLLQRVQLRDNLSGDRLGCVVIDVDNKIAVLLVERDSLVVDIFQRVIAR